MMSKGNEGDGRDLGRTELVVMSGVMEEDGLKEDDWLR